MNASRCSIKCVGIKVEWAKKYNWRKSLVSGKEESKKGIREMIIICSLGIFRIECTDRYNGGFKIEQAE